jgi:hypothetical protein
MRVVLCWYVRFLFLSPFCRGSEFRLLFRTIQFVFVFVSNAQKRKEKEQEQRQRTEMEVPTPPAGAYPGYFYDIKKLVAKYMRVCSPPPFVISLPASP